MQQEIDSAQTITEVISHVECGRICFEDGDAYRPAFELTEDWLLEHLGQRVLALIGGDQVVRVSPVDG